MRRAARIVRGVGSVILGLVAVCALVVGVAFTLLRTSWGGEQVRRLALRRLNATVAGRLELRRFHFGGDTIVLEGVALRDPDDQLALQVARVEVRFRLLALLARRLDVERIEIERPSAFLREDAKGLNLTRALASRKPSHEESSGRTFAIEVERLRLTSGLVDFRSTTPGAERHVRVVGLTIQGDASLGKATAAEADLEATLEAPLRAPLSASLEARTTGADGRASLSASVGESVLHATADSGGGGVSVNVRRLHVTPAVVRAFAPAVQLLVPIELEGRGSRLGDEIALSATIKAAAGAVQLDGAWDAARMTARDVVVRGERLDAGAVLAELPRSSISFELRAHGGGRTLGEADGELVLTVPPGTLSGARFGPAVVRAHAEHGQLSLRELHLTAPGVDVRGAGTVAPKRVDVRLAIAAVDLGLSARSLAAPGGARWPHVAGKGRLDVGVSGTLAAPALTVKADVPTLAIGGDHVGGLVLSAHVADVRSPQVGSADLHVANAQVGGRTLHDVALELRSTAQALALRAATRGPTPVTVTADGTWGHAHRAFTLAHLEVRTAELGWTLGAPARLALQPEHLSLAGLDLRSGHQRIRVDLDKRRERLKAAIRLDAIDLGALPPLALPPGLVLGGRLDLSADVEGTVRAPEGRAKVTLADGRVGTYRDLSLDLDADVHAGRARGTMSAAGLDTSVRSRFDLPARWPLTARAGPVLLELDVAETDLARVLAAFEAPAHPSLAGRAALSLRLGGTVAAPELTFEATTKQLVIDGQRVGDASLRVATRRQEAITANVHVDSAGTTTASPFAGTLDAEAELSLATLLRNRPTSRELLRTPVKVRGQLERIPLAAIARLAGLDGPVHGVASVRVATEGSALAPSGALNVTVTGASGPRFPATDGRLDVAFGERDVRLAAEIVRGPRKLAWVSGTVGLAPLRLTDVAALADAPLELQIGLGPLDLHRARLPGADSSEELAARGRALLRLEGTPRQPRLQLTADVDDAHLGETALGEAHAVVTYDARHAAVDVKMSSGSSGALTLRGGSDVDLGYPEVTRGLKVGEVPLDYTLEAQRFDLRWFSGLNDVVAEVGGKLSAKMVAHGTLGAPQVNGQAECQDGLLVLTSLGTYRDIHFKAHGDNKGLWLDELEAASGDGHLRLTGNGVASGASGYDVKASLKLERFPIYSQGLKLAMVSLDASSEGRVSARRAEVRAKILDAHLELTEAKQKNLQTLDTPADVVLLRDGKPVGKAEARKLEATTHDLDQLTQTAAAAAAASAPPAPSTLELAVDAPRNLWIKGKDAALELGLSPDFRVELADEPRLYGQVKVLRGRLDVLGRRFDLQKDSTVRFSGAADNPTLDVTAKYVDEQENVTATVAVRGTPAHLNISVSSADRPDLTEGQLYGLIITGHLQPVGGGLASGSVAGGAASPAASLVGGLVAAQLQSVLAKQLPLDVLTIDAGDGLTGSRLEAGTYLTERLYAGYVGRVGANPALLQNRNAVRLEYHLSERWSFDGEYGDVGTGTADLLWTKNY